MGRLGFAMQDGTLKRIVCLANSRKEGGRCLAGKEVLAEGRPGAWVRPVSERADEAVSEIERQYADGGEPRLGDVIDVPLRAPRPKGYQRENWLLDPARRWRKARRLAPRELAHLADSPAPLWVNGHHTHHGRNDRVPLDRALKLESSLRFIAVDALELAVIAPRAAQGDFRRRLKGRFRHAGDEYRLWATDPVYEERYLNRPNDRYELGPCLLTVSLGEPYQGYAYKLVAAIIEVA